MTSLIRNRITDENRRWWTLGAMCFALFMVMLDNTVVNVALPSIQKDLGASIGGLEWTVNAYTLSFAVLLITGGRIGDMFGRKRAFLTGVVIFGLSSAFISLAQTEAWLVTGRVAQGVGAAFMMPATLSIIANTFPPHERGRAIGTWAGVSAVALAIGPVIGGFLVENVSWQSIFWLNIPVAIVAIVVALAATTESRDESASTRIDVPGVLTLTGGLLAFVLALVEGNTWGWGSTRIIGLLVAAVVLIAAFVVIERRVASPMVDFAFFRSRGFVGANITAFIVSFAMLATFFFLALYLQNIQGYDALQAGIRFLPSTVVVIAMGPIAGRLADRIGPRPLITAGLFVVGVALFWQGHLSADTSYAFLVGPFVLLGLGIGLVMSPMSTAGMNAVDRSKAGVASGVLTMSRMVGATFGVAVLGALITGVGKHELAGQLPNVPEATRDRLAEGLGAGQTGGPGPVGDAVQHAFLTALNTGMRVGAVVALLGALLAWMLIDKRIPQQEETPAAAPAEAPTELVA